MNKINGYTEEEAKNLVAYIKEGKQNGKTLTYLFETYGIRNGRAKGSVRNYYYTLMKNEKGDERVTEMLKDSRLSVEKICAFTEEETDETLKKILREKSKGLSVRRAIFNLANGDDKLMLRLQNKYRNTLKKDPQRIATLAKEMGVTVEMLPRKENDLPDRDFLKRRLEHEINALYDRLTQALKSENERLRIENLHLKEELHRLREL